MRARKCGKSRATIAKAALIALTAVQSAQAAFFTWDGGSATTNNWTDPLNWGTNVTPANDGTADIIFSGAVRLTPNVDVAQNINTLQFASGSGAFTIGGLTITLSAAIDNKDDTTQTIQAPISLNGPGTNQTLFSGDGFATGNLVLSGTVLNNGHTLLTTQFNGSSITLSGAITGTGGFTVNGNGTTTLSGAGTNTYSGLTSVTSGTLILL